MRATVCRSESEIPTVQRLVMLCLALAVAACSSRTETTANVDPYGSTRNDRCYTVDLFSKAVVVPPSRDVPSEWRGFSGRWGGGAWAGEWCHDLYVLEIRPDGTATVVDTHAPLPEWGKAATAFRRTARIYPDGRLRMQYGNTRVEYWLEADGVLHGQRDEGRGLWPIAMARR
jgi:hypothetical protein